MSQRYKPNHGHQGGREVISSAEIDNLLQDLSPETREELLEVARSVDRLPGIGEKSALELVLTLMIQGYIWT